VEIPKRQVQPLGCCERVISPGDWHQQHVSGVAGVRRPNTLLRNTGSPFARVYYESRMSALILQAVLPNRAAITGNPGEQCAVCGVCKVLICKVLR